MSIGHPPVTTPALGISTLANAAPRIQDLPVDERPREKLEAYGPDACSDAELIAILLRTGRQGASALEIARDMLREYGSLEGLQRASVGQLAATLGIGPAKAVQLAAAFALGHRLARESVQRVRVDDPAVVERLLGAEMRGLMQECVRVLLLDARLNLMRIEEVSRGTLNESIAHPRDILRPALIYNAYGITLVHNHPSGDPRPSTADGKLTSRVQEAARTMMLKFVDHVILGSPREGGPSYFSFRRAGLLVDPLTS